MKGMLAAMTSATIVGLTCAPVAVVAGAPSERPAAKLTVFPRLSVGQPLLYAKMPRMDYPVFLCVIMKGKTEGEFRGHFSAMGHPDVSVHGSAKDLYECVLSPFPADTEMALISDVNLDGPIGVTGQVQTLPGH